MSIGKATNPIATKSAGKSRQKSPETDVILGNGIRKSLRPIVREKKTLQNGGGKATYLFIATKWRT